MTDPPCYHWNSGQWRSCRRRVMGDVLGYYPANLTAVIKLWHPLWFRQSYMLRKTGVAVWDKSDEKGCTNSWAVGE
ncbi:hypothetical protein BDZ45DRAFT_483784 [Acephala macrosclerotiorum]|nr:hypothetical protein BDZ45DRAFT_483784 [Acephala macrosclerotiorum]